MITHKAPDILIHEWLHSVHSITALSFVLCAAFLGIAAWHSRRNLRHNEPGLRAPLSLPLALAIAGTGVFGAGRFPSPWGFGVGGILCSLAGSLVIFADHRHYLCDKAEKIVADRWQIVLRFACFGRTRDKANRHFFFSGDTGSGKSTGMNLLLADLVRRNSTLGG